MSRLLQQSPELLTVPWFIKYAHYFWAFFLLGTGGFFFWETGIRSATSLLYEQHNIPKLVLPGLYIAFGAALVIRRKPLRYWHAILWALPMWAHLFAALMVEIPPPSILARGALIVTFVFGSASVEEFIRRYG